jgi:hypothetical protein
VPYHRSSRNKFRMSLAELRRTRASQQVKATALGMGRMDLCQQTDGLPNSQTNSQPIFSSPLHTPKHVISLVRHQDLPTTITRLSGPTTSTLLTQKQILLFILICNNSQRANQVRGTGGNRHGANWRSEFTHTAFPGGLGFVTLLPSFFLK